MRIATALLVSALILAPSTASSDPGPPGFGFHTETLSTDHRFLGIAVSPSGRYVAWREGTGIKLRDGLRGTTTDLPGPFLDPAGDGENLRASETHVSWRRVTAVSSETTEVYLYDIRNETLIEVYSPSSISDFPFLLLPEWLVWEGRVETEASGFRQHILAYRIRDGELFDLTPGDSSAGWLAGDGSRLAWAGDIIQLPGHTAYTTVRTYDLRTGRADLLDEGLVRHSNVQVFGDTVVWHVDEGTRVLRSATLRPGCSDGLGLAVLPAVWALRRRRVRR